MPLPLHFFFLHPSSFSVYSGSISSNVDKTELIHHHANRGWTQPSLKPVPEYILTMRENEEKALFLKKMYSKTKRAPFYNARYERARILLNECIAKYRVEQSKLVEEKRQEIRELHTLGSFGHPEDIRKLLFHLSSAILDSRELTEITFAISSFSGVKGENMANIYQRCVLKKKKALQTDIRTNGANE